MRGKLYSVGIGPGDPELMTLKSVRLLKECDVVAIPQGDNGILTAKAIVNNVVNLDEKEQVMIYMPMTKDMAAMDKAHREGADAIEKLTDKFAGEGRVLIRPSGTEPLVRVMIEGKDQKIIMHEAEKLAGLIQDVMF